MTKDDSFALWWQAYPRKVGKQAARRCWDRAVRLISKDQQIDAAEARKWLLAKCMDFAASEKGRSGPFCPHPSTWLNQGRYDDDPQEWGVGPKLRTVEEINRDWRP